VVHDLTIISLELIHMCDRQTDRRMDKATDMPPIAKARSSVAKRFKKL